MGEAIQPFTGSFAYVVDSHSVVVWKETSVSLISFVKYCIDTMFSQLNSTMDMCSRIYLDNSSKEVFDVWIMEGKVVHDGARPAVSDSVAVTVSQCDSD